MDYFKDAFGGFEPHRDIDASLKFILDSLIADQRIADLVTLMSEESEVSGLEGEPGWILERRGDEQSLGYENWPKDARFRAFVDPAIYLLTYPEFFCDRKTFVRYVDAIVNAFSERHPSRIDQVSSIRCLITPE